MYNFPVKYVLDEDNSFEGSIKIVADVFWRGVPNGGRGVPQCMTKCIEPICVKHSEFELVITMYL